MKQSYPFLSFLLLLGLIYYSFYSLMPIKGTDASISETEFSTERALVPLKEISKAPHYFGTQEHERVAVYLENLLKTLGLETQTQEGFVLDAASKNLDKPKNIIGRLKGSGNGKAVLLLSHYDSALVPSYGASDAGSGVVTILESVRAYIASGKTPVNDIIVLFTDCEEIGLDGANLFVNEHPWAKDVGFVMNFEARGSGGPSVMILESNAGNANLINAFIEANPDYPVASSLMYSVYKILPNMTDSTIFREDGDIDSFFFAFIDDHFDYHTANDTIENLDIETLQHQGSYLLPLLHYFANADLSTLKSDQDDVYVNIPLLKMIHYPFAWILPLLLIATVLFLILIFFGIKNKKLSLSGIGRGFIPYLVALISCGIVGYFGWVLLLKLYPQYNEVQHGFKYNGHSYIAFFVLLSLGILFWAYKKFAEKEKTANLFIAPITLWLVINAAVCVYLKGAGYFIIPVYFGLAALWILIRQEKPNLLVMALLGTPAIFLYAPLIQFFPVALGSEMVVIACIFTVLLFGLLLPVLGFYRNKGFLGALCLLGALFFFLKAHFTSDFSETRQKPNSLVYYQNVDKGTSYWVTYDKILDDWTEGYLGSNPTKASEVITAVSRSKYGTGYTYASEAPQKEIPSFETILQKDTIIGAYQTVTFTIIPKRHVNQIGLYADKDITFQSLRFNGKEVPKDSSGTVYRNRTSNAILRYYVTDRDSLEVSYTIAPETEVTFTALEYSFDLLTNSQFTITKRPKNTMPKPFVVTDAIVLKKTFSIASMLKPIKDSIVEITPSNE